MCFGELLPQKTRWSSVVEQDLRWLSSTKILMELIFVNDIDRVSERQPTELWADVEVEDGHSITLDIV